MSASHWALPLTGAAFWVPRAVGSLVIGSVVLWLERKHLLWDLAWADGAKTCISITVFGWSALEYSCLPSLLTTSKEVAACHRPSPALCSRHTKQGRPCRKQY